ncbi:MAG: hypothetical protein PVH65_15705, partial [Chloroflexota bacterium]
MTTRSRWLTPRQRRVWGEYLTGYLMIAPAVALILLFGIFPVAFALYVSVHKWRLVRSEFRGIRNYYEALDKFIYTILFLMAIACLVGAFIFLRRIYRQAKESGGRAWLLAVPSLVYATTIAFGFRWTYLLLPEVLDIADKIRGLERTRELFVGLLVEAFRAESVYPAFQQFRLLIIASLVLAVLFNYFLRAGRKGTFQVNFTSFWLLAVLGVALLRVTFNEVGAAYEAARETGTDPGIWPQLIMISSGLFLLLLGWLIWRSIEKAESNKSMVLRAVAAIALMVGAVMLIIEIPTILASGDPDLWQGLKVTVFFSMGTVPVQLAIALFLAVLLYQKLAGSALFRMIFFL